MNSFIMNATKAIRCVEIQYIAGKIALAAGLLAKIYFHEHIVLYGIT